jgi:glucokinase
VTSDNDKGGLPWLVADVGGTNARFGWVEDPAHGVQQVKTLPVAQHASLGDAAHAYLRGIGGRPRRAALAVATAVEGDQVDFTNSPWAFSRSALQQRLGVQALVVLNDFEALALSLPRLGPKQLSSDRPLSNPQGTLAVIGPGTGLGVAGVRQTSSGWLALPGEGGHATLAPTDDFESELLRHVRLQFDHVSAERLLSGIGLPVLHGAVAAVLGQNVPALPPEAIVEQALSRSDAVCERTVAAFCALLGGFAGSVALTLGARGGVYIGGGIVPRLGQRFFESAFRERFEAKGRLRPYLQPVPTPVITDTLAALSGAMVALEQLEPPARLVP